MTTLELAIEAIHTKQTLHFDYDDKPRIVEAHTVGVGGKGEIMRGYQIQDPTSEGWRLFTLDKITNPTLHSLPMSQAPRPGYTLNDSAMINIHAQVPA